MNETKKGGRWQTGCLIAAALPVVGMVASGLYDRHENREDHQRLVAAHEATLEREKQERDQVERQCDEFLATVKRGPSEPPGTTGTVKDRLVQRRLSPDDFSLKAAELPCADTSVERKEALWKVFVDAATRSLDAKILSTLDDELLAAIKARALTEEQIDALENSVEALATARLEGKENASWADAVMACKRVTTLGSPKNGPKCAALVRKQAQVDQQERAREKRDAAVAAGKERASAACVNQCDRTFPDMGPRWDTCNNKCLGLEEPLF